MILLSFIPLLVLGGLVALVVAGFRAMSRGDDESAPVDTAEAAKSFAIHFALFLAFVAVAVGLMDLLQAFVEGDRIAGANTDVARGLSLLIVGTPVYLLLLRAVDRRYVERAELGDTRPHRGWTAYLVAALSTTLIATLVSVAQVAGRITSESDQYRPEEMMQLLVWAALWAVHWFLLRPQFRVRGALHLAIGSIVGLGWLLAGVAAVVFRILDEAYQSAFDESLASSYDITFWIVVTLTGAIVWAWHWLGHLNAPGSVEGDRRRSPVWYFTAIVAGVLPGLIAVLVSATAMLSGVLIWFIGSTDQGAAEYFEPAPALVTAVAVGFMTWAYHRWELERSGPTERNEAFRFHDYVVLATGLVGVAGSTAVVISQMMQAIAADAGIAGSLDIGNTLIVAVTVLAASAAVWWRQWSGVERHRATEPVAESDSIWRKLYLLAAFGVGGVVLSASSIWVLFVVLRDVLDTTTSHDTFDDLVNPVGWAVAVLGAVWYHLGVWRADRATLGARAKSPVSDTELLGQAPSDRPSAGRSPFGPPTTPPTVVGPPPPFGVEPVGVQPGATAVLPAATTIALRPAVAADAGELFTLQRAAAAEDALRARSLDVAGLRETLEDVEDRIARGTTTLAMDGPRIVGAITRSADGLPEGIAIAPDHLNAGLENLLLAQGSPPN